MPGLLLLIIAIAVFSLTLSHTDADGTTRTGLQGLLIYIKPDFHGLTAKRFLEVLLDAMSQLLRRVSRLGGAACQKKRNRYGKRENESF